MLPSRFLLHGICLLVLVFTIGAAPAEQARCADPSPNAYTMITESLSPYKELFSLFAPSGNVTFTVRPMIGTWTLDHSHLFGIKKEGSMWKLFIEKPSELSRIFQQSPTNICGLGMLVTFRCSLGQNINTAESKRRLYIRSLSNELTINSEATVVSIREDVDYKKWSLSLKTLFSTPPLLIAQSEFLANPYKPSAEDAQKFLNLAKNGDVRMHKAVDSEAGDILYYFNITLSVSIFNCKGESTVQAGPLQTLTGVMIINIINVNDNAPAFMKAGCPPVCGPPKYTTEVSSNFMGQLSNIHDGPIKVLDLDGQEIKFSITGGSQELYALYFAINQGSGVVSLKMPLDNIAARFINLTIMAKSSSNIPETTRAKPKDTASAVLTVFIDTIDSEALLSPNSSSSPPGLSCILGTLFMICAVLLM